MIRQYDVVMSKSAARFYKQMAQLADQRNADGSRNLRSAAVFSFIEHALDEISLAPLDQNRILAGMFSNLYRVSSGQLRIVYGVQPELGRVLVYHICIVTESLSRVIQTAYKAGKLDKLCGILGIEKTNLEEVPRSLYLN